MLFLKNNFCSVFIFFLGLIFIGGCNTNINNISDYEKIIKGEDSPFRKVIEQNGISCSLLYLPTDCVMLSYHREYLSNRNAIVNDNQLINEVKDEKILKLKYELKQYYKKFDQFLYFSLTIGYQDTKKDLIYSNNSQLSEGYTFWLQKLLFSLKENIFLEIPGEEKIPLTIYNMENNFGITKDRTFLLVFPKLFNNKSIVSYFDKMNLVIKEFGLESGDLVFNCDFISDSPHIQLSHNEL